jgi:chromosome segregation ATPase
MAGEISSEEKSEKGALEEERGLLGNLEEKIEHLLLKYQELRKERDELAIALDVEKEKMVRLEKKLELVSQDREKVKTRIDQLLLRLKGVDT